MVVVPYFSNKLSWHQVQKQIFFLFSVQIQQNSESGLRNIRSKDGVGCLNASEQAHIVFIIIRIVVVILCLHRFLCHL